MGKLFLHVEEVNYILKSLGNYEAEIYHHEYNGDWYSNEVILIENNIVTDDEKRKNIFSKVIETYKGLYKDVLISEFFFLSEVEEILFIYSI